MTHEPPPPGTSETAAGERLAKRIEDQARHRSRADHGKVGNLWQQVAQVGTLGWMIVLPIVAGAFTGHLLDLHFDTGVRWALALMALGVSAAGLALYRAIQDGTEGAGHHDD